MFQQVPGTGKPKAGEKFCATSLQRDLAEMNLCGKDCGNS